MTVPDTTAGATRSAVNATDRRSSRRAPARRARSAASTGPANADVGDGPAERVGDDRRLDPARERRAVAGVVAQLEPAGVADRGGEALAAGGVVEVGHRGRTELRGQLPGGAPQLGLLGRVPRVHGTES